MKKIISILVCVCVLLSAMVFTASAADVSNVVLTVDTLGLESNAYSAGTNTVDGVAFEWVQLGNYGDGIQIRDKADKGTSMFWNTEAFGSAIKEIKLVYSDSKSTYDNPDAEILYFGNEAGTYSYTTTLSTVKDTKEYTVTPDAATYTFFKFEHDYDYTAYWKSITIVLAEGGEVTPPAGDDNEGGEVVPPVEDEEDDKEEAPTDDALVVVDAPAAGTAYKFGMVQENLGKTLYLTGEMDGFYYGTTEDATAAADIYVEAVEGGYNIYAMVDGAKKYLNIVEAMGTDGKTHINATYGDTAESVYTFDATLKTFVTALGEKSYGFGTRNDRDYTTMSPCSTEYVDNFFGSFYGEPAKDDVTTDDTTDKDDTTTEGTTGGTTTTTPDTDKGDKSPSTGDNVGAVVAMAIAAGAVIIAASKKR